MDPCKDTGARIYLNLTKTCKRRVRKPKLRDITGEHKVSLEEN